MITINLNGNISSVTVNLQKLTTKQAIEFGMALETLTCSILTPEDFQTKFVRETCELHPDSKLAAVKRIKEKLGIGLYEAKNLVDDFYKDK